MAPKSDKSAHSIENEKLELLHARKVICDRLLRFQKFLDGQCVVDVFQIESRLKSVEEDFSEFDKIQTRLEFLDNEEENNRLETESLFYTEISKSKRIIAEFHENRNEKLNKVNAQTNVKAITKLPDLGLPTFYGKYETWYSFRDIFYSVVDSRNDLSEIDKFLYLKLCCKDDALKLIDSLSATAANYTIALDLLKKRYENKRIIINCHINNILFNLPTVTKESAFQLRKLLDSLHQHLSALEKLELPVKHWDALLIPIILQNLDSSIKREWENKQNEQNLPTLNELIEFLNKKCCTLEAINNDYSNLKIRKSHNNSGYSNNNSGYSNNSRKVSYSLTEINTNQCCICNEKHFIFQCPKFTELSVSQKYNEIKKHQLCSNCLRSGHFKQQCVSGGCKICKYKHNTALHIDKTNHRNYLNTKDITNRRNMVSSPSTSGSQLSVTKTPQPESITSKTTEDTKITMCSLNQNIESKINKSNHYISTSNKKATYSYSNINTNQVLLSTAKVLVRDLKGNWHQCYALLDSGSQSNLMSKNLCEKLQLNCEKINIPLSGISQIQTRITSRTCARIKSRFENYETELSFLVLPKITEKLPVIGFERSAIKYPQNINLADDKFNIPKRIDLLLGASIFFDLIKSGKLKLGDNKLTLQETYFGWIFSGSLNSSKTERNKLSYNSLLVVTNNELHESLRKFWKIEEVGSTNLLSKEEQYCEDYFKETTTRSSDGRFVVKYPFKQGRQDKLGNSKSAALKRLKSLETRFSKDENLKLQYLEFMKEYETLGHMTFKCTLDLDNSIEHNSFFLPHSAVLRNSVTTKCRVVFDASAKSSSGISFNDLLCVGPTLQDDLFSILLRLRLRKYVLNADVKMMYRNVLIDENERCYQQILWRKNTEDKINVYTLNTVTYGTSSAPFQATRCLKELASLNESKNPRTSKLIKNSFYMDDLLVSIDSFNEAIEIYHEMTEIFSQAKFELRKWSSNNKEILNYIISNSNSNDENLVLFQDKKELKMLGITWDSNTDNLKYSINVAINESKITKRTILSGISQIFDPLGLIGPAIIKAKLLIQNLWCSKLGWDQEVPQIIKETWKEFISQIPLLNKIKVNRHVIDSRAESIELYGFCDSSEKAYGACIYLCSTLNGKRVIHLLTAKSKVAPIKKQTLPRLELLAAQLLADLVFKVKNTIDINISNTTYFTDSKIVLCWLKIEPYKLKTFVANRISKIIEISDVNNWKHVSSKDNAADIISRGLNPRELLHNETWFFGPQFLKEETPLKESQIELDSEDVPELKPSVVSLKVLNTENIEVNTKFDIFQNFSSYSKLRRIMAYILRFKNRTLKKLKFSSSVLSVDELNEAETNLIKIVQLETFKQEISNLEHSKSINNQSKIVNLHPFLDKKGILRVGGRLTNSELNFDQKHPIILPYKHRLSELIILNTHLKYLHVGTQNLLSIIRLKFWPVNGKNAVKRVIKSCIKCFRVNPKPCKFLMGELPYSRVTPNRPFKTCGIDYAGPIYVKEGVLRRSKLVKTYVCIFVCFATKAIHIELVSDLTTKSFLNALKRFCSRRGKPSDIYSDNGSNFIGANNYFIELHDLINNKEHNNAISNFLANDQINWHFIPARSAHMGGLWEAAVKSMKFHLKRILGDASLHFEEMYTLLIQIEACLNSRPLTPLSNDINDHLPLTPSHFLIGESLASFPEEDINDERLSRLSRYQRIQLLRKQFWNRWSKEYLSHLQLRSKWKKDVENSVEVGSLVIVVEDNLPPLKWAMARVLALHKGKDNIVRVVTVRFPNGTAAKRSLAKICVLPIEL